MPERRPLLSPQRPRPIGAGGRRPTILGMPVDGEEGEARPDVLDWTDPTEPRDPLILSGSLAARVDQLVEELKQVRRFIAAEIDPPTRLLFTGPPGTGKTLAAKWIAYRLNLPIGISRIDAIVGSFVGETGRALRRVFDTAAERPCVLFLDELDALGQARGPSNTTSAGKEMERATLAMLLQLDALPLERIVIAATNRTDRIDAALRSRIGERVEFTAPTRAARAQMIARWLRSAPVTDAEKAALVESTRGCSGRTVRARAMRVGRAAVMRGAS